MGEAVVVADVLVDGAAGGVVAHERQLGAGAQDVLAGHRDDEIDGFGPGVALLEARDGEAAVGEHDGFVGAFPPRDRGRGGRGRRLLGEGGQGQSSGGGQAEPGQPIDTDQSFHCCTPARSMTHTPRAGAGSVTRVVAALS